MDHGFLWFPVAIMIFLQVMTTDWVEVIRKLSRREKAPLEAITAIEKLANLRAGGSITEEEFARLKQRCMAEVEVSSSPVDDEPATSPLGHVRRLAELHDQGKLNDEEFADARAPFLAFGVAGPTADELAGLAHIENLSELMEEGQISEGEFTTQKRAIFGGRAASMAKPVSAWNDLEEP